MKKLILNITTLILMFSLQSCKTQRQYSAQEIISSHEVIFSTKEWQSKASENLMEFYNMNISDRDKVKVNLSLNYVLYFEETFLKDTFTKIGFSNQFLPNTEYYFIALFVEGEVFYNQIYVLEKNLKCNDYLYTQAGQAIEFKNNRNVSCDIKQSYLTNLLKSEQILNTGVRNNIIIVWYIDKNRKEEFKIFYNPNYLQLQEADNVIYNKKNKQ
ncbi:MAG: hypothetical protein WCY77_11075 [Weeksellaceae bacterium]